MSASGLTPLEKGAIAELAIAARAAALRIPVLRPLADGLRYDLGFDVGERIIRVQCKWAPLVDGAVEVRGQTCRHSPVRGYVRTTYVAGDVDLVAAYCAELDSVYAIPITEFEGRRLLRLRVKRARNNQSRLVHCASDYELGAIAQLGERLHGMQEVAGSSPASSIEVPQEAA